MNYENAQILGVPDNEAVLGATVPDTITDTSQLINWIKRQSDTNIFLGNKTYYGNGQWGSFNGVSNKHIYGGFAPGDGKTSYFDIGGIVFHSLEGVCDNLLFEGIKARERLFWFSGSNGGLTNSVFRDCECYYQFIWLGGWGANTEFIVYNCNFTNCVHTYGLYDESEYYDGHGQFAAVSAVRMENCNFINVTSGHHGGAICIADESENGAQRDLPVPIGEFTKEGIPSSIKNCNFINVTSRWFTVYVHGNFSTSNQSGGHYIYSPQVIENCNFINCNGTGEYSGGLGISHDYVEVRKCEFINCEGGQGSAIMVGGLDGDHDAFNGRNYQANHVIIEDCNFTSNLATLNKTYTNVTGYTESGAYKHPPRCFYPSGDAGAIYVIGNDTIIRNCIFDGNIAEEGNGAAIYIEGERTHIIDSTFINHKADNGTIYILGNEVVIDNSYFANNSVTSNGAALYIKGSYTQIHDSEFIENNASYGGAVFIEGNKTIISDSNFTINNAYDGAGAYIHGDYTRIYDNVFGNNTAINGGGIYVRGKNTTVENSDFDGNNVTYQGGAMYIDGSNSNFHNNNFTNNEAVPHDVSEYTGLGGAIFVIGNNTLTTSNDFEHNKARNGSAVYSTGNNLTVVNDIYRENQAWSYILLTVAEPELSLYNTADIDIQVVHFGGDNMLNAIYNNASHDQIRLKNVTYVNSYGKELRTNETNFEHPEDGVENSEKGTKLYQDDREYHQLIYINVTDEDGNVIYNNTNITTNLYGDIYVTLPRSILGVGTYTVNAIHPEDWNYKEIKNSAIFEVLPNSDVSIEKTSDLIEYFDDDIAKWTITVKNSGNASNASNVVVDDLLPSDFVFIRYNATLGTYDNITGIWTIGDMANGTEATLEIYALVASEVDRMNHIVHIDYQEKNVDISIDRVVVPDKNSFEEDETANWTVTVKNNGEYAVHDVSLDHILPFEFEVEPQTTPESTAGTYDQDNNRTWTIGDLNPGQEVTLKIISRATTNVATITNLMILDYREKHINITVNKSSDKDEYHDGEEATWTITVHNGVGCDATNVVLKDILQPEFEFISYEGSGYNEDTNEWTIGDMAQDSEAVLVIKSRAITLYGNVTNLATVTCDEAEWDYDNNVAECTVRVVPLPIPTKTVNNITPNYNGEIEYNITLTNVGNYSYEKNLTVIDSLPEGLISQHC